MAGGNGAAVALAGFADALSCGVSLANQFMIVAKAERKDAVA